MYGTVYDCCGDKWSNCSFSLREWGPGSGRRSRPPCCARSQSQRTEFLALQKNVQRKGEGRGGEQDERRMRLGGWGELLCAMKQLTTRSLHQHRNTDQIRSKRGLTDAYIVFRKALLRVDAQQRSHVKLLHGFVSILLNELTPLLLTSGALVHVLIEISHLAVREITAEVLIDSIVDAAREVDSQVSNRIRRGCLVSQNRHGEKMIRHTERNPGNISVRTMSTSTSFCRKTWSARGSRSLHT